LLRSNQQLPLEATPSLQAEPVEKKKNHKERNKVKDDKEETAALRIALLRLKTNSNKLDKS